MKTLLEKKNSRLMAVTAVVALITGVVYVVQSLAESTFFFLIPLMLGLGIVFTAIYLLNNRFTPLPSAVCYSVSIGALLASMLTNIVNTYVRMAQYNLVCFYFLAIMMALCSVAGIVACFSSDC